MRRNGRTYLLILGTVLLLLPVLSGAQEKPYSIMDDLQKYAEEYKYEEFRPIQYFGVIDARIRTTGESEGEKAVDELGLSRAEVNSIANKLLAKYEDHAEDAPIGCEYHECYDVAKAVPTQEHYDMYRRIKDEIADMGIEFPF